MNEITKPGPRWYRQKIIHRAYVLLENEYNKFALQETSRPWWEIFRSQLTEGELALDLGCGSGVTARYLTDSGLSVIGIDISKNMVDLAAVQAPQGIFFQADMGKIRWPEESFHGICSFFSLLHIPKRKISRIMGSVYRWLKPNGVFAITVVEGEGEGLCQNFMGKDIPVYLSYYREGELNTMLAHAGFKVIITRNRCIKTESFEETEFFLLAQKTNKS